jgi:hypothetical protein
MAHEVELSTVDLRYESYRMRNPALESRLLASIVERGIEEPLEGVDTPEGRFLLNGFKRYRCARKLGIGTVPYVSIGDDEATGILAVLRTSNNTALSILEQAHFIDDLRHRHRMSVADIAETVSRSKGWVGMRLGLFAEMSEKIREKMLSGAFPVYSYMYLLRQFMRMNGVTKEEIEAFVQALSGKKLSTREIEQLAHGYFRGPAWFREEVLKGNLAVPLERMKQVPENPDGCNEFERVLLKDLEIAGKSMRRIVAKSQDRRLKTPAFCAQANLLAGGILSRVGAFTKALRELHDRSRHAQSSIPLTPKRDERAAGRPPLEG